jgi:hypothetical protein
MMAIVSEEKDQNAEIPREIDLSRFEGHTPGPWYLNTPDPDPPRTVRFISDVCTDLLGATDADARLIAAAPDLLAAYKQKAQLADALWNFIEYFCPDMLHEATDCWNSNYGEYREIED